MEHGTSCRDWTAKRAFMPGYFVVSTIVTVLRFQTTRIHDLAN